VELVLDQSLLLDKSRPHKLVTHRNFDLDIFDLKTYRWATEEEIFAYNGNPHASLQKKAIRRIKNTFSPKHVVIQKYNEYNENYFATKNNVCFVGRWQSELYFKDVASQVRKDFTIPVLNDKINYHAAIINDCEAVCLHVRRADLITSPMYSSSIGVLTLNYYTEAINYIRQQVVNPVFFIFSDDINWCRQNIILP